MHTEDYQVIGQELLKLSFFFNTILETDTLINERPRVNFSNFENKQFSLTLSPEELLTELGAFKVLDFGLYNEDIKKTLETLRNFIVGALKQYKLLNLIPVVEVELENFYKMHEGFLEDFKKDKGLEAKKPLELEGGENV